MASIVLTKDWEKCRACGNMITIQYAVEFIPTNNDSASPAGDSPKLIDFQGTVAGLKIDHDCLPKAKRGRPANDERVPVHTETRSDDSKYERVRGTA